MSHESTADQPAAKQVTPQCHASCALESALHDQRQRWQGGERVAAQDYLDRHPEFAAGDEATDLIYQEFLLAEEAGGKPDFEDLVRRYPRYAESLRLLRAMDQLIEIVGPRPSAELPPLRTVGDYELLAVIGEGGMGVVYKARQVSLDRTVALKMIRGGEATTARERERFRNEALATAALHHPGLVAIHEVGDWNGQPYLCMEYVEGPSLDRFAAGHPLPPEETARIVAAVAEGVEHAHQNGVLHRDLKPANVLIDAGRPRVTDFGIAKRGVSDIGLTETGVPLGTPSYMSPELAAGRHGEVGPPSDVYSLGAILYELLTGRPPFRAGTALETLRQVLETEPAAPRQLNPAVPADLETVCLKCLQKDPTRRYPRAADVADELGRFLRGEPVLARPVGGTERFVRWCRRRPVTASLLAALAVVTACGLGGVVWQWRRADRAAEVARQERDTADRERALAESHLAKAQDAIDFIARRIADGKLSDTPHAQGVQREMLEYALRFHEGMLQDGSSPATRAAAANAYLRTGAIRRAVGDTKAAEDAFQNAVARYRELVNESPESADYRRGLITGWNELATLWSQLGRAPEAANAFDRVETLLASAPAEARLTEMHRSCQASVHLNRAVDHLERREHAKAEPQLKAALTLSEGLSKADPQNEHYREQLAAALASLGVVFRHTNRGAEATEVYRRAIAAREGLVAQNPSLNRRTALGTTYRNYAILKRTMGASDEAREQYRRAQGIFERLADDFPDLPRYRFELAQTLFGLAVTYAKPDECAESAALLEKAVGHQRRVLSMNGQNQSYRDAFRRMTINLAVAQADLGLHQRAAECLTEFIPYATATHDFLTALEKLVGCMALAAADATLSPAERTRLADRYVGQACEAVRVGKWYLRNEMATLRNDPKFAALRGNAEFQQLLAGPKE